MASPRALQIAEEEFRASVLDRLDRIESMLGEILGILGQEGDEPVDDAATFGDEPGAEVDAAEETSGAGFMDDETGKPSKRSKSKTL